MKLYISHELRKIICEIFGYDWYTEDVSYQFNFITLSPTDRTRLSGIAINKGINCWMTDSYYAEQGTYLKVGKFLRAIFPNRDNDEISQMACKLQKVLTADFSEEYDNLKISDTPSEVYAMTHSPHSSVGGSCMRHMNAEIFELYDYHPGIKILYLVQCNELVGRALLHDKVTLIDSGKVIKLMDRIYSSNDNLEALFKKWATNNGYHHKYQQQNATYTIVGLSGEHISEHMSIECPSSSFDSVPYMDTFQYYCSCSEILHTNDDGCCEDTLKCTDGTSWDGVLAPSGLECSDCDCRIHEDTARYFNGYYYCEDCYYDRYGTCDHCEEDHHRDYLGTYTVDGNEVYLCDDCINEYSRCEACEDFYSEVYKLVTENSTTYVCEDCLEDAHQCPCGVYTLCDICPECELVLVEEAA